MYFLILVLIIFIMILIDKRRTSSYKVYIKQNQNKIIHSVPPSKCPAPRPPGRQY